MNTFDKKSRLLLMHELGPLVSFNLWFACSFIKWDDIVIRECKGSTSISSKDSSSSRSRSNGNTKVTMFRNFEAADFLSGACIMRFHLRNLRRRLLLMCTWSLLLSPSLLKKKYWKNTWNSHFIFRLSHLLSLLVSACLSFSPSWLRKALASMLIESNVAM